jgi:hypothetical protein
MEDNSKTVEEELHHAIYCRGLFEDETQNIIDQFKAGAGKTVEWNNPKESYPESMRIQLLVGCTPLILAWMDENCPMHWGRALFKEVLELEHKQGRPRDPVEAAAEALKGLFGGD